MKYKCNEENSTESFVMTRTTLPSHMISFESHRLYRHAQRRNIPSRAFRCLVVPSPSTGVSLCRGRHTLPPHRRPSNLSKLIRRLSLLVPFAIAAVATTPDVMVTAAGAECAIALGIVNGTCRGGGMNPGKTIGCTPIAAPGTGTGKGAGTAPMKSKAAPFRFFFTVGIGVLSGSRSCWRATRQRKASLPALCKWQEMSKSTRREQKNVATRMLFFSRAILRL
jgi:hypothetical protein